MLLTLRYCIHHVSKCVYIVFIMLINAFKLSDVVFIMLFSISENDLLHVNVN